MFETPAAASHDDRAQMRVSVSVNKAASVSLGGLFVFALVLLVIIIPAIRGAPV